MSKYRILVEYRTGDSFSNEDTEEYIDIKWDILEIAKENLQAIKEHWEMYSKINEYSNKKKSKDKILFEYSDKWWFVKNSDSYYPEHQMNIKADNGNLMQQTNYWCGYFEHLNGAKIETDFSDIEFTT